MELTVEEFDRTLDNVLRMHLPGLEAGAALPRDVPLSELGLDSLRAVSLVLDLEDTFAVEFPDRMLNEATFHSAGALREALRALAENGEPADA